MKKKLILLLLAFCLVFCFVACSGEESPPTNEVSGESILNEKNLVLVSGSNGSMWNLFGGQWGEIIMKAIPGTTVNVEPGGAVSNYQLCDSGDVQFAQCVTSTSYEAYNGEGEVFSKTGPLTNCRSWGIFWPMMYHCAARDKTGIDTYYDIKGHTYTAAFPGQTGYIMGNQILDIHGIDMKTETTYVPGAMNEAFTAMQDGQLDVWSWNLSIPQAPVIELALVCDIHMVEWGEGMIDAFLEQYPQYTAMTIPKESYSFLEEDYQTVGVVSDLICHKDLTDEFVYQVTKATWENYDLLLGVSAAVQYMTLENAMKKMVLPLHPGAYRYYVEVGCDVPERLMPID